METIQKISVLYPAIAMMLLTLFLYTKNYFDNVRAAKKRTLNLNYFKVYKGEVPDYIEVTRQTLKNQFELPIFFYFLISVILAFGNVSQVDVILAWAFVWSRYIHCYIRLTNNYVPWRSKFFIFGMIILIVWWSSFLINIL